MKTWETTDRSQTVVYLLALLALLLFAGAVLWR